jgi:transposase-like protein
MQPLSLTELASKIPDEAAAYLFLEEMRWQGRPVCAHCGSVGEHYFLTPKNGTTRKTRTGADTARRLWKCRDCRKQFTVLTNTIMHRTKVPIRTWLFVLFEMSASKNGLAAREIERKYRVTPRTAWHMTHRIREAMRRDRSADMLAGTIMADETYIGGRPANRHAAKRSRPESGVTDKTPVFALIHGESGEVRSRIMPKVDAMNLRKTIEEHVQMRPSTLVTDELRSYRMLSDQFTDHIAVNHSAGEYAKAGFSTNAVEGFFSQLKRSLDGTHHHISVEHLDRYLAEFDFRYSTCKLSDAERMQKIVNRVAGRRLLYRASSSLSEALVA